MTKSSAGNDPLLLLIEPDPWRQESLEEFLRRERFDVRTVEVADVEPELVLMNLCDRPADVRSRLERLRVTNPSAKVLAFVREVDASTVFPCLLLGVKGVLPFDARPEDVRLALHCVMTGSIWTPRPVLSQWIDRIVSLGVGESGDRAFTPSERRVLEGIRDERTNKEIARQLGITEATVKFHIGKLLKKTGTKDRRELARFVLETLPAWTTRPAPAAV